MVVEFVGSLVVANTGIPGRQLIHSGTFSSTDLVGVLAGQTIDQFFAMLRGEQMTQIGGLNLPLLVGPECGSSSQAPSPCPGLCSHPPSFFTCYPVNALATALLGRHVVV